jgi:dihydrofolate synthase/folylpolyglutamate synthase
MSVSSAVSDYASALEFLLGRVNYERTTNIPYRGAKFKLDRMRRLLALLGDPHLGLAAVHIAGTKGKGSTAAMIAGVLTAAGHRTGLYTSPHLARIEERMAIDGLDCPQAEFVALAAEVQQAIERLESESLADPELGGATFFEITTAMAFLHFARARVAAAVLEVGLGGRLDSTNVCRPEVCVITSISFDHMKQLGHTLAAIAGEKAGIIKPRVPVISGVVRQEPSRIIAERATEVGTPLWLRGRDYDLRYRGESFDYFEPPVQPQFQLAEVELHLLGEHQAANAAAAICALNRLRECGWDIPEAAVRSGLAATRAKARIEVLSTEPTVILDVAHNPASIEALLGVLRQRWPGRRRILVFASSKDKDYAGMLKLLLPEFDAIVLTRYVHNPRAADPAELLAVASATGVNSRPIETVDQPTSALARARRLAGPHDLVCITGSFFLAAELRPLLLEGTVEIEAGRKSHGPKNQTKTEC